MPTQAEVIAATPLTEIGAEVLGGYLRTCEFYLTWAPFFKTLTVDLAEFVAVDSTKSKTLSAILTAIEVVGDGTIGVKGGKFGADYSKSRDREQLCILALGVVYDFAALGLAIAAEDAFQQVRSSDEKRGGCIDGITIVLPGVWPYPGGLIR